eukprot:2610912-Amphidinium_carterae.1
MRVNSTTTFAEVHTWISNYFNNTYSGTDEEQGTIRGVNNDADPQMITFKKWKEGKGYNNRTKGWTKGKDKGGGKKGDFLTKLMSNQSAAADAVFAFWIALDRFLCFQGCCRLAVD